MSKFLLLSVIRSDFSKMINLARLLRDNGHDVAFYFEQRSHNLYQSIDEAVAEGFTVFGKRREPKQDIKKQSPPAKAQTSWTKIPVFLKRVISEVKSVRTIQKNFTKVIKDYHPNALIVPACSVGYNVPVYAAQSHKLNLPTICIPFAISDKDAAQKAIRFSPKSAPDYLMNRYFRSIFAKWYLSAPHGFCPVLPAEILVAYKFAGIDAKFPLSFYGTRVDRLLLENEYMLHHARAQSFDAGSVEVTGSIFDDELAAVRRERESLYKQLCMRFSWDAARPLVCIALPPFVREKENNERFFDFDVLAEKFLPKACDFTHVNVLVSLHPRISRDLIASFQCPANVILLHEPVERFIPFCDIFVSTYSSTIRTAVAMGIPVINYDILDFDYELFRDLKGVVHVSDEYGYVECLSDALKKGAGYAALIEQLQTGNLLRSAFDGRSSERILNAITQGL
jgi:hypothetical protein